MSTEHKKRWYGNVGSWLPNMYYIAAILSFIFILGQVVFARRSIVESSQWEKAKITIENIDKFKETLAHSPIADTIWWRAEGILPDFETEKGRQLYYDSIFPLYISLFTTETEAGRVVQEVEAREEIFRFLDVMNDFAYPIIMGYASEIGSYQSVARQYLHTVILSYLMHLIISRMWEFMPSFCIDYGGFE